MTNPSKARKANSIKEFSVGTIKEKEVFLHKASREEQSVYRSTEIYVKHNRKLR